MSPPSRFPRRLLALAVVAGALLALHPGDSPAQGREDRQYYGPWVKHASKPYYYRFYYYKPTPTEKAYKTHYGIYYPSRGQRVYLYNPDTRKFWGYWEGGDYSLLPQDKRAASLDDIPAEAFPKPGKPPKIPEADDDVAMEAPPNDFPKPAGGKP